MPKKRSGTYRKIPLWFIPPQFNRINFIMNAVQEHFIITRTRLLAPNLKTANLWPRMIAMFFAREFTGLSANEVGIQFGVRCGQSETVRIFEHGAVNTSVIRVNAHYQTDTGVKLAVDSLRARIAEEFKKPEYDVAKPKAPGEVVDDTKQEMKNILQSAMDNMENLKRAQSFNGKVEVKEL